MSPRRRRRIRTSLVSPATALEIAGAVLIGIGLERIYFPLAWIWSGLAAFGLSYVLELKAEHDADASARAARASGTTRNRRPNGNTGTAV